MATPRKEYPLAQATDLSARQFQRILVIKPSSLGDIIHALPVLTGLRSRYPDAKIAWLAAELEHWRQQVSEDPREVANQMLHWMHDVELDPVRDTARLPVGEREAWAALWAEVKALHDRAWKAQHAR